MDESSFFFSYNECTEWLINWQITLLKESVVKNLSKLMIRCFILVSFISQVEILSKRLQ